MREKRGREREAEREKVYHLNNIHVVLGVALIRDEGLRLSGGDHCNSHSLSGGIETCLIILAQT